MFPCLQPPHRGDSGVSERAARDLSQFAVQARALSVHPQASQRLCGSFPATAPGRGQRHRPGSYLFNGYVHKHQHTVHAPLLYPFTPAGYTCTCPYMPLSVLQVLYFDAVKCSCSCGFASEFNTTACTMKRYFSPHSAQRVYYTGTTGT